MGAHPVLLRRAERGDIPLILNSWLNSHRQSFHVRGVEGPVYYAEQRRIIETLMPRSLVLIACDPTMPSSIFGWMVAEVVDEKLVVHFLYVKGAFQDHGVGTALVEALLEQEPDISDLVYTHQTRSGRKWAEKMAERSPDLSVAYNPFLLYRTLGAAWS